MKLRNLLFIFAAILAPATAIPQSGGTFVIQKSVIANGGDQSSGGTFLVTGTMGEAVAGTTSTGGTFQLGGGFWGGGSPVAAFSVSGTVTTADGRNLRNAGVTITNNRTGAVQTTLTGSFGTYQFNGVQADDTYTVNVTSKHYRFLGQTVLVNGNLTNVNFAGDE